MRPSRSCPHVDGMALRIALVVAGVLLNAVATAAYIGVRLGPGPRDGLMTGLGAGPAGRCGSSAPASRSSWSRPAGCSAARWASATVLYAVAIGPLVQPLLPVFTVGAGVGASSSRPAGRRATRRAAVARPRAHRLGRDQEQVVAHLQRGARRGRTPTRPAPRGSPRAARQAAARRPRRRPGREPSATCTWSRSASSRRERRGLDVQAVAPRPPTSRRAAAPPTAGSAPAPA